MIYNTFLNRFKNNELKIDKYTLNPGTTEGQDLIILFKHHFKEKYKDTWLINNSFDFALVLSKYHLNYKEYEEDLEDIYPFIITLHSKPENFLIYGSLYTFITFPHISY